MFKEEKYIKHLNRRVKTPFGYQTIESVFKTHPQQTLIISTNLRTIEVSEYHTFVVDEIEILAKDLIIGDKLQNHNGYETIETIKLGSIKELYDICLSPEFDNQWYYSSGILSHNSGKSITVACYLCWLFTFFKQRNIGIVANRGAQAREFLKNTKNMLVRLPMWMTTGVVEWNKGMIGNENDMRILTDVPSSDSFRGYSVHCLVIDEAAFINPNSWEEFADSIFPSQSALAWKKNIIISTANGLNHFYEIVQRAKASTIRNKLEPENHDGTELVEVDWKEVPRHGPDGPIKPEDFKKSIVNRFGTAYFEQNYGNNFMGSTETLILTEILESMKSEMPIEQWSNMLQVYRMPEVGRTYLMGVDAAKDGEDNFAVQILDITEFPFKQVASAKCQTNYLEMPEYLYMWACEFNTPLMIVENNEGAGQSIADTLMMEYEYPNLYFDRDKRYPGFRTTSKSRLQITKLMQVLLNSGKIELVDANTIEEFKRFEKVNGKYQASEGHDDMVMSLALSLVPLLDSGNFEDYKTFLTSLKNNEVIDTKSFLTDLSAMSFADI